MIEPLLCSRTVAVESPLPPAWLRRAPTNPDVPERVGASVYRVGSAGVFRATLVAAIDEAQEVVLIASFLLSDEKLAAAMLRAFDRGVRIYVLTASEARLSTVVRDDDGFDARMVDEHKKLLNRLAERVVLRSAEHFHAKLLVTDPASDPRGWISTANFNKALQESVELGVELAAEAVTELAAWFSWAFWTEAERELTGKGRLAKVTPPPRQPPRPTPGSIVATARDERSLGTHVLELIAGAKEQLLVSSYGFDEDHAAVRAIEERAKAGVGVTVVTRPRPAVSAAVQRLVAAGARVLAHDKLHAKAIVADSRAMVMTANLQHHGLDSGFEVGVVLGREATESLTATLRDWTERFPWRFEAQAPRSSHLGDVCFAADGLRDGVRSLVEEHVVSLGPVTAASALNLEDAAEPAFPPPPETKTVFQQVRYEWEVRPPRLPKKAKEVFRTAATHKGEPAGKSVEKLPYQPAVFVLSGQKYVIVEDLSQADDALRLSTELDAKVVVR